MKIIILIISFLIYVSSSTAQLRTWWSGDDLLKGKVKMITSKYYYPKSHHTSKHVVVYDTLGRIESKTDFYSRNNPNKEHFIYDSLNNITMRIVQNSSEKSCYSYTYIYNSRNLIVSQTCIKNDIVFQKFDSIRYDDCNRPVSYREKKGNGNISEIITLCYGEESNVEKKIKREVRRSSGDAFSEDLLFQYDTNGLLVKKITASSFNRFQKQIDKNSIEYLKERISSSSYWIYTDEYDYVDYKYDKQGNWIERKVFFSRDGRNRFCLLKEQRIIKYY